MLLTQRHEPGVEYVAPVVQEQLVPTYHWLSKTLNPPAPVVDTTSAVITMSPLREINTNTDILPGLSIKNLSKSKNTMKLKSTNTWIGCEVESCKFWAHAACVGVDIGENDDAKTVTFFCEEHK